MFINYFLCLGEVGDSVCKVNEKKIQTCTSNISTVNFKDQGCVFVIFYIGFSDFDMPLVIKL